METYDVAIIGSGPGGYAAAIRCAQLGYKTALIEKYAVLGGTCTNTGCIPTKALLDSTEHYFQARHHFQAHGIALEDVGLNFQKLLARKDEVVSKNTQGLRYLMQKHHIAVIQGRAEFSDNTIVRVQTPESGHLFLKASYFIIATGSTPASLPGIAIDKDRIISSTQALKLPDIPKSMTIIGGGVVGVELASVYNRIGTKVVLLEYADELVSSMDRELGKHLRKMLCQQGIDVQLGRRVYKIENAGSHAVTHYRGTDQEVCILASDYVLLAVGRTPYTQGLGLENTDVQLDENGRIVTNKNLQTAVSSIYAIGDVTTGPMLAHKATEEGVFVAESINGQKPHITYPHIPSVVYTSPEAASVGLTEEALKTLGIAYKKGTFPFSANVMARACMDKNGFVKVLSDAQHGIVLGVHIVGPRAADLIAQAVVAMEYKVRACDLFSVSYAHPTYSEALKEAYRIASGHPALTI